MRRPGTTLVGYASARGRLQLRPARAADPADRASAAMRVRHTTVAVMLTLASRPRTWARAARLLPLKLSPILTGGPCAPLPPFAAGGLAPTQAVAPAQPMI